MHGPSSEWKKDNSSSIKELLGKWLFVLYAIVYGGFIVINIVSPKFMGTEIGSLNVALIYGFLLIVFAMFLAFVYNHVSSHTEEILNNDGEPEEPKV
jgi:uncharacterized membrane protein (DUF485 family)